MPTKIFISHSTRDKEVAESVLEYLRANGYTDDRLFLDSDSQSGLLPGRRWERELFESLEECACLIAVCTNHWKESQWCFAEALIAKNLDRKIVPLLVSMDPEGTIVSEYQAVRGFSHEDSAKLEELRNVLVRSRLAPPGTGGNDAGWTVRTPDEETRKRILAEVHDELQGSSRTTHRFLVVILGVLLIFVAGVVLYASQESIERILFPPEVADVTVEEFVEIVRDPSQRESIKGKWVELHGEPIDDYSAGKPRILLGNSIEVNIQEMRSGDPIPGTLPEHVQVEGVVDSISPPSFPGAKFRVYMSEVVVVDERAS